jgi:hypothetical protein
MAQAVAPFMYLGLLVIAAPLQSPQFPYSWPRFWGPASTELRSWPLCATLDPARRQMVSYAESQDTL